MNYFILPDKAARIVVLQRIELLGPFLVKIRKLFGRYIFSNFITKYFLNQIRIGNGLYNGKVKLSDLNNDGQLEIILAGLTSENTTSGLPKLYIYYYDELTNTFNEIDASNQISSLSNSSFDLGDFDNDQDIDFIITGFDQSDGLKSFLYSNVSEVGGDFKLEVSKDTFGATRDGSIDFFDFDTRVKVTSYKTFYKTDHCHLSPFPLI